MSELLQTYGLLPFFVCGFLFLALGGIIATILEGKKDRLSGFSPGQQKALKLQNNSLTCWAVLIFLVIFIIPATRNISSELSNQVSDMFMVIGGVAIGIIAISSIISRASILRPRGRSEFTEGKDAVGAGVGILIFLGLAFIWWLANNHK
jgi:hypothetical protein